MLLRSLKDLIGYKIRATDGEIGKVDDFYIDDRDWKVRFIVDKTGGWLFGRQVLISTASFERPDWEGKVFPVSITKEQVENSPPIESEKLVSRENEEKLNSYYGWPVHYGGIGAAAGSGYAGTAAPTGVGYAGAAGPSGVGFTGAAVVPGAEHATATSHAGDGYIDAAEGTGDGYADTVAPAPTNATTMAAKEAEPKDEGLRSVDVLTRYDILSESEKTGYLEDFIVDDENWTIRYLVLDTKKLLDGKKVLIAPEWIHDISWSQKHVSVDIPTEKIQNSPDFDISTPITRAYEESIYNYFGRPKYWE